MSGSKRSNQKNEIKFSDKFDTLALPWMEFQIILQEWKIDKLSTNVKDSIVSDMRKNSVFNETQFNANDLESMIGDWSIYPITNKSRIIEFWKIIESHRVKFNIGHLLKSNVLEKSNKHRSTGSGVGHKGNFDKNSIRPTANYRQSKKLKVEQDTGSIQHGNNNNDQTQLNIVTRGNVQAQRNQQVQIQIQSQVQQQQQTRQRQLLFSTDDNDDEEEEVENYDDGDTEDTSDDDGNHQFQILQQNAREVGKKSKFNGFVDQQQQQQQQQQQLSHQPNNNNVVVGGRNNLGLKSPRLISLQNNFAYVNGGNNSNHSTPNNQSPTIVSNQHHQQQHHHNQQQQVHYNNNNNFNSNGYIYYPAQQFYNSLESNNGNGGNGNHNYQQTPQQYNNYGYSQASSLSISNDQQLSQSSSYNNNKQ